MISIPKEYGKDLLFTQEFITAVEKSHHNLSEATLMSVLCDIGDRTLLMIGISGTGKDTIANYCASLTDRNVIKPHGITVNGLKSYQDQLNSNSTTIIVGDLAKSGSEYMQINTISVLCGIVYDHRIEKHNATLNLEIENVQGAALIYAQPLILKKLVKVPEFESDISDKTVRFYHLFKPTLPNMNPLNDGKKYKSIDRVPIEWDEQAVGKYWKQTVDNFEMEHSLARAMEHARALMKASALFNGRKKVSEADAWLVYTLSQNFRIEQAIYNKKELEGERQLDANLLPLLTVLATYPKPTITTLSKAFKLSEVRVYAILKEMGEWVLLNKKELVPTAKTKALLKEIGV